MNSISMTTMAAAAMTSAMSVTLARGGKMESIESTTIIEEKAEATASAATASTISTPTSSLRLSHLSNPAAISNLTTSLISTSTNSSSCITAITKEFQTPNSLRKSRNGTFHSLPIVNTPTPPSRYRKIDKIDNPFESYITERLHKPLIDSPSLFRAPATPQASSTQWDGWNIDEISSLNPANIEAHETQFESSSDPNMEAKNQANIFTFFKETIIVPSPDTRDKQLLAVARNVCDNSCQTELTLPPILPKEVEDALRPYFTFMQNQQKTPSKDCDSSFNITMQNASVIDHDARDASLRRKLLYGINVSDHSAEYEREVHLDSPAPQTPEMQLSDMRSLRFDMRTPHHGNNVQDENEPPFDISLNSIGKESFGRISPISKEDAATTPSSRPKSLPSSRKKDDSSSSLYRSTPDHALNRYKSFDMTTNNAVNCSYMSNKRKSFHLNDEHSSESNETVSFSYDDEMQISYGSQQHPQTPQMNRSKRRCNSVNRKNLSRSFIQIEEQQQLQQQQQQQKHSGILLNRTDSGFNEPTESSSQHTFTQSCNDENDQLDTDENSFTFHNLNMMKSCDVSMASIN